MASPKNTITAFQEFLQRSQVAELLMSTVLLPQIFSGQANLLEASLANAISPDTKTTPTIVPSRPQSKSQKGGGR